MNEREDFIAMVGRMRHFQRKWFAYHNQVDLTEAKRLEREVDHWLERHWGPKVEATLFDKMT